MMKKFFALVALFCIASSVVFATDKGDSGSFDRGVGKMNSVFIPKGYIGAGVSFSYKTYELGQSEGDVGYSMLFSLLSGIKGEAYTLGVAPTISFFVANNFSIGGRFDYNRTQLDLGNLGLNVGDLLSFNIKDYHFLKNAYAGALTGRYYMPIANSKRIAMFGELRLGFELGESVAYTSKDGVNSGTFQTIYGGDITIVPGLCVFATDEVCVEVAVGILGIDYQYIKQQTNLVEESVMQQSGANFKINPLSISLGLAFYLPMVKPKTK
jgi:opacity protein-like surface antigen